MATKKTRYVCQSCGAIQPRWLGKCPSCEAWNTFVEELIQGSAKKRQEELATSSSPLSFSEIDSVDVKRIPSGSKSLDRVLGGGIVPGSTVLFGGEPGVGKSTLLLQTASNLAKNGFGVLYITAEESAQQIKLRGERLKISSQDFQILTDGNVANGMAWADKLKPSLVIIDSIQACHSDDLESSPGTVSQVREITSRWNDWSKRNHCAVAVVGHVTKDGAIAGPKIVEHIVDTVLLFEGDESGSIRILRSLKNRFGSTGELSVFEMNAAGLKGLANPSRLFFNERETPVSGVAVTSVVKGSRPLLAEVQALVSRSFYTTPQRNATGIEPRRLSMLIAVLEKRVGLNLSGQDIFLNVTGGLKLDDSASDLAAAAAIYSSLLDRPISSSSVLIGEIGLTGEVRNVSSMGRRISEAAHMGFKEIIAGPAKPGDVKLRTHGYSDLHQALKMATNDI